MIPISNSIDSFFYHYSNLTNLCFTHFFPFMRLQHSLNAKYSGHSFGFHFVDWITLQQDNKEKALFIDDLYWCGTDTEFEPLDRQNCSRNKPLDLQNHSRAFFPNKISKKKKTGDFSKTAKRNIKKERYSQRSG